MTKIDKCMILGDIVKKYPGAVPVLFKYGLHCIGCHVSAYETIEQGCLAHGISSDDIDKMIIEMNKAVEN